MDEKPKNIELVPKRKVYIAWVLVLALAAILIGLSLFLQRRASAAVQVQLLDSTDLELTGYITEGAADRCARAERDVKQFKTIDDIVTTFIEAKGGETKPNDKTAFSSWLRESVKKANDQEFKPENLTAFEIDIRTNEKTGDSETVDLLTDWADCLDGVSTTCENDKISTLSTEITNAVTNAESTQIRDINITQTRHAGGELTSAEASAEIKRINKELQGQELGNTFDFGSKLDELASLYDKCSSVTAGSGTGATDRSGTGAVANDTGTNAAGTGGQGDDGESTIGKGMKQFAGVVAGAVGSALDGMPGAKELRRLMQLAEREMLDRNDSALRVHEYNVGLLRRAGIKQAVEGLFSAIKSAGSGNYGGVMKGLFDAWDGYSIAKYAPDFLAQDKPFSREFLQSTIDLANTVGDTGMLSQYMGGGAGVFGADGSLQLPYMTGADGTGRTSLGDLLPGLGLPSDATPRLGQAVDPSGAVNQDFLKDFTLEQLQELKTLGGTLKEKNGFLRDTDKDGVPDKIATDCTLGDANCFYYQKVEGEYLFMPAKAVLNVNAAEGIVSLYVAKKMGTNTVYPFLKGPAVAIDKVLEQVKRMVFQRGEDVPFRLGTSGGATGGSGAGGSDTDTANPPQPPPTPTDADKGTSSASVSFKPISAPIADCEGTKFTPTAPTVTSDTRLKNIETLIANKVMQYRTTSRPTLNYDTTLAVNARRFAEAMLLQGCIYHTVGDETKRLGSGGENLYASQEIGGLQETDEEIADAAIDLWKSSKGPDGNSGHDGTMLSSDWNRQGVGVAISGGIVSIVNVFYRPGSTVVGYPADSPAFWTTQPTTR